MATYDEEELEDFLDELDQDPDQLTDEELVADAASQASEWKKRVITRRMVGEEKTITEQLSTEELLAGERLLYEDSRDVFGELDASKQTSYSEARERADMELIEAAIGDLKTNVKLERAQVQLLSLYAKGGKGKEAVEGIMNLIDNYTYTDNPARILETKEAFPVLREHMGIATPKITQAKKNWEVIFDATDADRFLKEFSRKTLLKKQDLQHVSNVIFNKSILQQVRTTVNDFLEEEFMKLEGSFNQRYGLAVEYNRILTHSKSRLDATLNNLSADRSKHNVGMQRHLKDMFSGDYENVSGYSYRDLLYEYERVVDRSEKELRSYAIELEFLSNSFLDFTNNNSLVNFGIENVNESIISDLSFKIELLLDIIEKLVGKVFSEAAIGRTSVSGSKRRGISIGSSYSGGLILNMLYTNLSWISGSFKGFINILNNLESSAPSRAEYDKYFGPTGLKKVVNDVEHGEIRSGRPMEFYGHRRVKDSDMSIRHVFYINRQLNSNLRAIGVSDNLIKDIRAIVSHELFNRSGLQDKVADIVQHKILSKI